MSSSEASFRAVIERSPDGIVIHHHGTVVYVNPAMVRLLGHESADELLGRSVLEAVPEADRPVVAERVRRVYAGEAVTPFIDERLVKRDGTILDVSVGGIAVTFDGKPCIAAICRDLTEQRRLQARLVEADRMVALGTLSAGLAHEINNPLTYLLLHVDAAATFVSRLRGMVDGEAAPLVERLAASVAIAQDGAGRVRDIIRDLRIFARTADDDRRAIDPRRAIERALAITAHELRHRATVVTRLDPVPAVHASDGRLTQVFVNLLINAAHALGDGDPRRHRVEVRTWAENGDARIAIRDTGHGVPAEHLSRIFDPFFTTKPVGQGAGLGLAIVHGIITSLGGTIAVETTAGEGATFVIRLPAAPEEPEPPAASTVPAR